MANDGTVKIGTELDDSGFKSGLSKLGSVASGALKGTVAAVGSVATAASGAVAGLLALESATEEYRVAQGKLNTAFEAAGYDVDTAQQAYSGFYRILGDTDTATEASQLLAKLAQNAEDVGEWTRIAAGVNGTFGDSLPIEGLIEASNETAKVGQVTGVLADALNWAGISEDEFNAKLAECSDESERNQLIMETLSGTYDEAADAFYRNNEALIQARNNQFLLDETMSILGDTVAKVKNNLLSDFLPAIYQVTTGLSGMLSGTEGAEQQFSTGISSLIDAAVARLPEFLDFGAQILVSILNGLVSNIPTIASAVPQIASSIVSAFSQMGPQLATVGSQLLSMLANGIMTGLPVLSESAVTIMGNLAQYVRDNLPSLIETGLEALVSFSGSLRENAGLLVDGALGLIQSLASGLIDSIPVLIETVPEIVTNIANIINDNAPKLLLTAAQLIGQLALGLIQAIPTLVANIPQIIEAIVAVFTAFNWLNLGKTIITSLKDGIISMKDSAKTAAGDILKSINDGLAALPSTLLNLGKQGITGLVNGIKSMIGSVASIIQSIGSTILSGLKSLPSQVLSIGKNIIQGLINGIKSGISGVASEIANLASSAISSAKKALGIHSPSTVMRDQVGKNIGLGVAEGITDSIPDALSAAKKLASSIPSATIGVEYANASMAPASAPRFSTENALTQAAAMMAMGQMGGSDRPFVIELNGREVARGIIPNIRAVEKQTPAIQFN